MVGVTTEAPTAGAAQAPPSGPTIWAGSVMGQYAARPWSLDLSVSRWAPAGLLLLSIAAALAATPELVAPRQLTLILALSGVVVVLRVVGELMTVRRLPLWAGSVGYGVHAAVVLVLVLINPLASIYAFTGYLDADRFLIGRVKWAGLVVTATLGALGQIGGLANIRALPWLFVALLVVNIGLATTMTWITVQHERAVREREEAAEELGRIHQENLALQESLLHQARERGIIAERERVSREIHDTVAQGLIAVIAQLESVPASVDDDARRRIERAEAAARHSLAEARRAVAALASPLLDDGSLTDALEELVHSWSDGRDLDVRFHHDGVHADVQHADVLVRVAQEALSNIVRHAGARHAAVSLTAADREIRLDVGDDGQGFHPASVTRGHGLDSMSARVAAVGGSLEIEARPGAGCTVTAAVPR